MKADMQRLIEEIRGLSANERRLLRETLGEQSAGSPAEVQASEQNFKRRLLEAGLLSKIKPPIGYLAPYQDRKVVRVTGKPLSETIAEERR